MKKIPTIFVRDMTNRGKITEEWHADCLWVRDGEGVATIKWDGTCCLVRDGKLYKRREIRQGDMVPADFELTEKDEITGKHFGWVPVGDGPEDQWHREAIAGSTLADGTYELLGPKVQGWKDKDSFAGLLVNMPVGHFLIQHGQVTISNEPTRTFDGLKAWLPGHNIEGIVWHHPDGRMAKIKKRDFGLRW